MCDQYCRSPCNHSHALQFSNQPIDEPSSFAAGAHLTGPPDSAGAPLSPEAGGQHDVGLAFPSAVG